MKKQLFHIFRNNPLGRETLRQSVFFCLKNNLRLIIYLARNQKFLMYFDQKIVEVTLDSSFLHSPQTALQHIEELVQASGVEYAFWEPEPKDYTSTSLPNVPVEMDFMCCPRSLSDKVSKLGLGYLGPKVRAIAKSAHFPVLIPSPIFQEWQSISIFFGGSNNALNALRFGLKIASTTRMKINMFTQVEKDCSKESCEKAIRKAGLEKVHDTNMVTWYIFENQTFEENLYHVPPDSLVVLGTYGKGILKKLMFGSKAEKIQATLPNNLLVVGQNCQDSN